MNPHRDVLFFCDSSQWLCDAGSRPHPGPSSPACPWPLQSGPVPVSQTPPLHPRLAALWRPAALPGRLRWSPLPWVSEHCYTTSCYGQMFCMWQWTLDSNSEYKVKLLNRETELFILNSWRFHWGLLVLLAKRKNYWNVENSSERSEQPLDSIYSNIL